MHNSKQELGNQGIPPSHVHWHLPGPRSGPENVLLDHSPLCVPISARSTLYAPLGFFLQNPVGELLLAFTRDQDIMDEVRV